VTLARFNPEGRFYKRPVTEVAIGDIVHEMLPVMGDFGSHALIPDIVREVGEVAGISRPSSDGYDLSFFINGRGYNFDEYDEVLVLENVR